jgi:hypothetical protein
MGVSAERRYRLPLLEIWDRSPMATEHGETSVFGPDFRDLLLALPAETLALEWAITEIGAIPVDDQLEDLVALEATIDESPTGVQFTGEALLALSGKLLQVIDAVVVGYRGSAPLRSDPDLRRSAEIVIEAIDSTLWRVFALDDSVREHLERAFTDVRKVPAEPIPAVRRST